MTKYEFLQRMEEFGIEIEQLGIFLYAKDKPDDKIGVFFNGDNWYLYDETADTEINEFKMKDEAEAFDNLYFKVFEQLKEQKYINEEIIESIAKTTKYEIFDLLNKKNYYSDQMSAHAWSYLKKCLRILMEFKYYMTTGYFVPDDSCLKIIIYSDDCSSMTYSAESLCNSTFLSPIGAFNYMIYLQENQREALRDLAEGLKRK